MKAKHWSSEGIDANFYDILNYAVFALDFIRIARTIFLNK